MSDNLDTALLAVQSQAPTLVKEKTASTGSYSYSYVGLDGIVETIKPLLAEHKLVFQSFPTINEHGQPALRYRIKHVPSGESDGDTMLLLLGKQDSQAHGSAITYARRYALCAVLNLVADEDDDGKGAGQQPRSGPAPLTQELVGSLRQAFVDSGCSPETLLGRMDELGVPAAGFHDTPINEVLNKRVGMLNGDQAKQLTVWLRNPQAVQS